MPVRTEENGKLMPADRVTLGVVLDRLIPPVDDLRGAGRMGLAPEVERVAGQVPRYRAALLQIMDALSLDMLAHAAGGFGALSPEQQVDSIREVEQSLPKPFAIFLELVYLVYYGDRRVHERIGWQTGPLRGFELPPFDEAALERVRTRRPFWRKA
jgi:hypothetical protein